jgi:hypothetical protein
MYGLCLERFGFQEGARIEVTGKPHRLVLTVIRDDLLQFPGD